mmetsp:Transcript_31636/g.73145  ORF Transcript_31636/g.73145 Transcript_31636/m.73145 type:complete len:260 (-) Transcript_31636:32-811(-)
MSNDNPFSQPGPSENPSWMNEAAAAAAPAVGQAVYDNREQVAGLVYDNREAIAAGYMASQQQQQQQQGQPAWASQPPPPPPAAAKAWNPSDGSYGTGVDKPKSKVPSEVSWALKVLHLICIGLIGFASFTGFVAFKNYQQGFICLYLMVFASILCLYEIKFESTVKVLSGNCGFLLNTPGRIAFLLLLGFLPLALGTWGTVAAVATFIAAAANLYVGIKYDGCCGEDAAPMAGQDGVAAAWANDVPGGAYNQGNGGVDV